jgi:hypothetical protein
MKKNFKQKGNPKIVDANGKENESLHDLVSSQSFGL